MEDKSQELNEIASMAAIARPSDIVILRATRPLSREATELFMDRCETGGDRLGIKIMLIDSDFEVAQIVDGRADQLRELIAEQKRTNELLAALLAQGKTAVALSVVS